MSFEEALNSFSCIIRNTAVITSPRPPILPSDRGQNTSGAGKIHINKIRSKNYNHPLLSEGCLSRATRTPRKIRNIHSAIDYRADAFSVSVWYLDTLIYIRQGATETPLKKKEKKNRTGHRCRLDWVPHLMWLRRPRLPFAPSPSVGPGLKFFYNYILLDHKQVVVGISETGEHCGGCLEV